MSDERVIRVALVDDDPSYRENLARAFATRDDVEVVASCGDGHELLSLLGEQDAPNVDIALVDVDMPRIDGIRVVEAMHVLFPEVRAVMLTVFRRNESLQDAMAARASGFLTKSESQDEMVAKMRTVLRGDPAFSPGPLSILSSEFSERARNRASDQEFVAACEALPEHLARVMNGLIVGEDNKALRERHGASPAVMSNYVSEVVRLTGCTNRTEVALRAARCGYPGRRVS